MSESLLALAIERRGVLRGAAAIAFMAQWAQARDAAEEWPTDLSPQVRAYARHWRVSERTAWREISRFREVWPEEESPSRLLDQVAGRWERNAGIAALGAVVLDA